MNRFRNIKLPIAPVVQWFAVRRLPTAERGQQPQTEPAAPPEKPREQPVVPPAPRPEPRREPDPFNPVWPETRPTPEPKAWV